MQASQGGAREDALPTTWIRSAAAAVLACSALVAGAAHPAEATAEPAQPWDVPAGPDGTTFASIRFDDQTLYAAWDGPETGSADTYLYSKPLVGGSWIQYLDPRTNTPLRVARLIAASGGTVLVNSYVPGTAEQEYVAVRATTAIKVGDDTSIIYPDLAPGGRLVSFRNRGTYTKSALRTDTGEVVGPTIEGSVSGSRAWNIVDGVVTGRDLLDGQPDVVIKRPELECAGLGRVDSVGRWAAIWCNSGESYLMDLNDQIGPVMLPHRPHEWHTGNGFIYNSEFSDGTMTTSVLDPLSLEERQYTTPTSWVETAGERQALYFDNSSDHSYRTVSVDWLTRQVPVDTTPPIVAMDPVPAASRPGGGFWGVWHATDPEHGLMVIEVRSGSNVKLTRRETFWLDVPGEVPQTCFAVRARDRFGNTSDWTADQCVQVDNDPPQTTGTITVEPYTIHQTWITVSGRFAATDDTGIARYEIAKQTTDRLGVVNPTWLSVPAPHGVGTVTVPFGHRVCMEGRGVDLVERMIEWRIGQLPVVCASSPYDDSAMLHYGKTALTPDAQAMGGSSTTLKYLGKVVTRKSVKGSAAMVRLWQGPGQGVAKISFIQGTKKVRLSAATGRWIWVHAPATGAKLSSVITVKSISGEVRVDAVGGFRTGDSLFAAGS